MNKNDSSLLSKKYANTLNLVQLQESASVFVVFLEVTNIEDEDMKKIFKAAKQQAKAMLEPFEDKCKKKKVRWPKGRKNHHYYYFSLTEYDNHYGYKKT